MSCSRLRFLEAWSADGDVFVQGFVEMGGIIEPKIEMWDGLMGARDEMWDCGREALGLAEFGDGCVEVVSERMGEVEW